MTVRDLLSDESKWCKGVPREGVDEWCLLLAIDECYPSQNGTHAAIQRIRATGLIPRDVPLTVWNDAPERMFADVRRVIEEAKI